MLLDSFRYDILKILQDFYDILFTCISQVNKNETLEYFYQVHFNDIFIKFIMNVKCNNEEKIKEDEVIDL